MRKGKKDFRVLLMVWNEEKELEKKRKKYPNEILCVDTVNKRIETSKERKQRIDERNIGIKSGVIVGILLGVAISLLLDVIQKIIFPFNPYIEIAVAIILILVCFWLLYLMKKGDLAFY